MKKKKAKKLFFDDIVNFVHFVGIILVIILFIIFVSKTPSIQPAISEMFVYGAGALIFGSIVSYAYVVTTKVQKILLRKKEDTMEYKDLEFIDLVKFYNCEFLLQYPDTHPALSLELCKVKATGEKVYCVAYYQEFDPEAEEQNPEISVFDFEDYALALDIYTNKLLELLP